MSHIWPLLALLCFIFFCVWPHLRSAPASPGLDSIERCPACGHSGHLCGVGDDAFVRCLNPRCSMQGPYGSDERGAIAAWNSLHRALPRRRHHDA